MKLASIAITLCFIASSQLFAQTGRYSLKNLPTPGEFPAHMLPTFEGKEINSLNFPMNKGIISSMHSQYNTGPNFAGHYTVVSMGCGGNCQTLWIFDPTTGHLITNKTSHYGSQYSLNSRLLVINPPSTQAKAYYFNSPFSPYWQNMETEYYVLQGHNLKLIFKAPMAELLQ